MVAIIVKSYCGPLLTVNTVWLSKYRAVRNLQYTVLCTIVSAPKISTLLWQGTFEFTVKSFSRQSMAKQQIVLYLVMCLVPVGSAFKAKTRYENYVYVLSLPPSLHVRCAIQCYCGPHLRLWLVGQRCQRPSICLRLSSIPTTTSFNCCRLYTLGHAISLSPRSMVCTLRPMGTPLGSFRGLHLLKISRQAPPLVCYSMVCPTMSKTLETIRWRP